MAPFLASLAAALGLVGAVSAQYFPPTPEGLRTVESKIHKGVKISYKEVLLVITLLSCPVHV